jgi:hypothetical protein
MDIYDLYIEKNEVNYLDPTMGILEPLNNYIGFKSQKIVPTGKRINYDDFGLHEKYWRKQFDRYNKFKNEMMELAYSKYQ